MDGLMFETEKIYFESAVKTLKEMGHEHDIETHLKTIGTACKDAGEIYQGKYGCFDDYASFCENIRQNKINYVLINGIPIKIGLLELLEFLDENGIKTAIASSSPMENILKNLKTTGLTHEFDYIISGNDLARSKPDPEIFVKTCKDLNISRDNAIVLEDSLNGLRAAYSAGVKCIVVPDMISPDAEMMGKAWRIEENLLDVKTFLEHMIGG